MTKLKIGLAPLILLTFFLSLETQAEPTKNFFRSVELIQPVQLEKPVSFWKNGKKIEAKQTLLLKVRVTNPLVFAPRNSPFPQFMMGETACELVRDPLSDGVATLLAPSPAKGESRLLWLTPSAYPQTLTPKEIRRLQAQTGFKKLSISIPMPSQEKPILKIKDLGELQKIK